MALFSRYQRQRATIGPELGSPFTHSGISVRFRDDLRKTVVFLGRASNAARPEETFKPDGTGFLLTYGEGAYLVTAAHVAKVLASTTFYMRLNTDTGARCLPIKGAQWVTDEQDKTVDVAITTLDLGMLGSFDTGYIIGEEFFWHPDQAHENWNIGVGDMIYVVGLFKFHPGRRRNVPIVHSGNIVMMPEDEKIEIEDWNSDEDDAVLEAEAYLVECHALDGLSGSPVFVRGTGRVEKAWKDLKTGKAVNVRVARDEVLLLGLFHGSWDAKPAKILAEQHGLDVLVPTNVGVVVPVHKIEALIMKSHKLKGLTQDQIKARKPPAATLKRSRKKAEPEPNPNHHPTLSILKD